MVTKTVNETNQKQLEKYYKSMTKAFNRSLNDKKVVYIFSKYSVENKGGQSFKFKNRGFENSILDNISFITKNGDSNG